MPKMNPKKSKLSTSKSSYSGKVGVIDSPKEKQKPTSIRLTLHDKQIIAEIKNSLNKVAKRKISESDVIRALIILGSNADIEEIFDAYKENM